jgi:hypothetical protein
VPDPAVFCDAMRLPAAASAEELLGLIAREIG